MFSTSAIPNTLPTLRSNDSPTQTAAAIVDKYSWESPGSVLGSPRESSAVRQTGLGEEPCLMCVGGAVGVIGTQCSLHDMQLVGASQREHRIERAELSRGEGQASSERWQIHYRRGTRQELVTGNSNCR